MSTSQGETSSLREPSIDIVYKNMNVYLALFYWPIHIHHTVISNGSCNSCILTPVAPKINSRDVADSRCRTKLDSTLFVNSTCQALIGRRLITISSSDHHALWNDNLFPLLSVFDRYESVNVEEAKYGYFDSKFQLNILREDAKGLLHHILNDRNGRNHKSNVEPTIDKLKKPHEILFFVATLMSGVYKEFVSDQNYDQFINDIQQHPSVCGKVLPNCVSHSSKQLIAIYLFQLAFPYCMAFFNGNHRHSRILFDHLMLERKQLSVYGDSNSLGYIVPSIDYGTFSNRTFERYQMSYQLFSLHMESQFVQIEQLQLISFQIHHEARMTVPDEKCHR